MKKLPLHWKIIIGLILGVIWAILSSYMGWTQFTLDWINPFGTVFINLLKMIAVPLVLFSIISGIASLKDVSRLGKISLKTFSLFLVTTVFSISLGLILVNFINPGSKVSETQRLENRAKYEVWANNTEGAMMMESGSSAISGKIQEAQKTKEQGPLQFVVDLVPSNLFHSLNDNSLMLQVIFFALFFGICLMLISPEKAKPILDFVDGGNEIFLKMVDIIMKAAPFFVFALLAGKISEISGDNPAGVMEVFKGLSWYSLTVVIGLAMMIFIVYPLLIRIFAPEVGYTGFFKKIAPAQMLAFSTSSSAATLPVTIECVQDNIGVSEEVSSFVLPIGATVNMDGTSLYQAVAVVFLAQFHMIDLSFAQQLTIVLTATLASIGAAAVPGAGLVMLIIVLESVGLNPAWIAIIFPVDRILDMCRTVVNVTSDITVSTIIAKSEGKLNPKNEI